MIRKIKTKDKNNFLFFCSKRDYYSDFYITKDNKRYFLNNLNIANKFFNDCLKRGDRCLVKEENGIFKGMLIVTGYANKFFRKYLKVLGNNKIILNDLCKVLVWDFPTDLYVKIKNTNPLIEVLIGTKPYNSIFKKNSQDNYLGLGFRIIGNRNQRVLLYRKYDSKFDYSKKPKYVKEGDEE